MSVVSHMLLISCWVGGILVSYMNKCYCISQVSIKWKLLTMISYTNLCTYVYLHLLIYSKMILRPVFKGVYFPPLTCIKYQFGTFGLSSYPTTPSIFHLISICTFPTPRIKVSLLICIPTYIFYKKKQYQVFHWNVQNKTHT